MLSAEQARRIHLILPPSPVSATSRNQMSLLNIHPVFFFVFFSQLPCAPSGRLPAQMMRVSGFSRWSPRVTALTERTGERRRRASADGFHHPVKSVTEPNRTSFKYYTSPVCLQLSA